MGGFKVLTLVVLTALCQGELTIAARPASSVVRLRSNLASDARIRSSGRSSVLGGACGARIEAPVNRGEMVQRLRDLPPVSVWKAVSESPIPGLTVPGYLMLTKPASVILTEENTLPIDARCIIGTPATGGGERKLFQQRSIVVDDDNATIEKETGNSEMMLVVEEEEEEEDASAIQQQYLSSKNDAIPKKKKNISAAAAVVQAPNILSEDEADDETDAKQLRDRQVPANQQQPR